MAAFSPFEPNVKSATAGFSVAVSPAAANTGGANIIDSTTNFAPGILATNTSSNIVFVRLAIESSTLAASTVSITDTPLLPSGVRLFGNPSPAGKIAVAVICSVTTPVVIFTPGQGGDA